MGFQDYISEQEAASRAGVSARTLQRFAEAGYLHVEIEPDGLRLYPRAEIEEIFGVHQGAPAPKADAGAAVETTPPSENPHNAATSTTDAPGVSETVSTTAAVEQNTISAVESEEVSHGTQSGSASPAPDYSSTQGVGDTLVSSASSDEVSRLRNLIKAQEKLLDMKEAEIKDLRMQRDWLQTRVERLEEKSDRDQILLLSETQTIRRLISMQEQKRSAMKQLLDWLGFSPSKPIQHLPAPANIVPPQHASPIGSFEVKKAANE